MFNGKDYSKISLDDFSDDDSDVGVGGGDDFTQQSIRNQKVRHVVNSTMVQLLLDLHSIDVVEETLMIGIIFFLDILSCVPSIVLTISVDNSFSV
jgi:hypothetical protein